MIGASERLVTVATVLKLNNTSIRRGYNRAIDWSDYGDADAPLRDRLAVFRPCCIEIAVPAHGADSSGEIHHRCRVALPLENGDFIAAYLDVSEADYRTAIVSDIPRMLELELPAFADDPMDFGVSRAKNNMLEECFAHLDEYDAQDDVRE
ncbi:MAG: hypothetical protein KGN02_07565 [bacterium]|nr:hypothetical protein [bacterium]